MSTLHTVNHSPFSTQSLLSCLNHAKDGDSILMIEDGVYGADKGTALADAVAARAGAVSLYVLGADMEARGLDTSKLIEGVKSVDYAGFVDMVVNSDRTQSWL